MPRGASPKREHEYAELKREFKQEHRYAGRENEVAARIINKQRKQYGETKVEKKKGRQAHPPHSNLPIDNYQHLTIPQVTSKMGRMSPPQLHRIKSYEQGHKRRKGVLHAIERKLHH